MNRYHWRETLSFTYGAGALTVAVRLFKYMSLINGPHVIFNTLKRALKEFMVVVVILAVMILAFAMAVRV